MFKDTFKTAYDQAKRVLGLRKLYLNEDGIYTYDSYPKTKPFYIEHSYLKDFIYALEFSTLEEALSLLDNLIQMWYTKENQALYYYMTSTILNEMFQTTNKEELIHDIGSINHYYQTLLETKSVVALKASFS